MSMIRGKIQIERKPSTKRFISGLAPVVRRGSSWFTREGDKKVVKIKEDFKAFLHGRTRREELATEE